jgi:hypothetical protein
VHGDPERVAAHLADVSELVYGHDGETRLVAGQA